MRDNFYVDTAFGVIHEDGDLLVIDKPAPLAVHAVGSYAGLNLQSLLQKDPRWAGAPIKTIHRLDAETSGVLVIAKNYEAARSVGKQFMEGRVRKVYEAIVFGCPALPKGEIREPLGYDKASGFHTIRVKDPENGEAAHTSYEVIKSGPRYARLRLRPTTGRTHQLRAHLAILGHPIVGDKIYVDPDLFARYADFGLDADMIERLKLPRLALHATEAAFAHPRSGAEVVFRAPLAPLLRDFAAAEGLE